MEVWYCQQCTHKQKETERRRITSEANFNAKHFPYIFKAEGKPAVTKGQLKTKTTFPGHRCTVQHACSLLEDTLIFLNSTIDTYCPCSHTTHFSLSPTPTLTLPSLPSRMKKRAWCSSFLCGAFHMCHLLFFTFSRLNCKNFINTICI